MFDGVFIGGTEVLLLVAIKKQGNGEHVAGCRFVSEAFAGGTLDPRFVRTTPLVRTIVPCGCGGFGGAAVTMSVIPGAFVGDTAIAITAIEMRGGLSCARRWAMSRRVVMAVDAENPRSVTLDEEVWVIRVGGILVGVVRVCSGDRGAVETWGMDVSSTVFGIVVDEHGDLVESKLVRNL